jgi:hypothetical protein
VALPPDSVKYAETLVQANLYVEEIMKDKGIKYFSLDTEWPVNPGTR